MSKIIKLSQKMTIVLINIIIIFLFVMPSYSHAKTESVLADGFQTLIFSVCDGIMKIEQKFFVEDNNTTTDGGHGGSGAHFGDDNSSGHGGSGAHFGDGSSSSNKIKYGVGTIVSGKLPFYDINFLNPKANGKSTANILAPTVKKYYGVLRAIALVSLLSVLVYIGIKIVISSTAGSKAKYKNKLVNVIVAICLLFMMQYIMAILMYVTDLINDAVSYSYINNDGNDKIMSEVRKRADISESNKSVLAYTVMYAAMTFMTVRFTIMYIKRTLTLVLLTTISPVVTVTYPIDKEGDGKAQAFSFWLREYVFNIIIQPIHMLLYIIFVESSMSLVDNGNFFWALVVMMFMVKAEGIIKQMFGINSNTLAKTDSSIAGMALATSAARKVAGKIKSASSKGGKGNSGSEKNGDGNDTKIRQKNIEDYNEDSQEGNSSDKKDNNKIKTQEDKDNEEDKEEKEKDKEEDRDDEIKEKFDEKEEEEKDKGKEKKEEEKEKDKEKDKEKKEEEKDKEKDKKKKEKNKKQNNSNSNGKNGNKIRGIKRVARQTGRKVFTAKNIGKIAKVAGYTALGTIGATLGLADAVASGDVKNIDKFVAKGAGIGIGVAGLASGIAGGTVNVAKKAKGSIRDVKDQYQIGANNWSDKEFQENVLIPRKKKENAKNKDVIDKYERELGSADFLESKQRDALYDAGITDENQIIKAISQQQRDNISYNEMVQNTLIASKIKDRKDLEAREKQVRKILEKQGMNQKDLEKNLNERMKRISELSGIS